MTQRKRSRQATCSPAIGALLACLWAGCAGGEPVAREASAAPARPEPAPIAPSAPAPSAPAAETTPAAPAPAAFQATAPGEEDAAPFVILSDGWLRPAPGNPDPPEYVLVQEVLRRLRQHDAKGLQALRVTPREYARLIYPEAIGDERNKDFYWTLTELNSLRSADRAISRHGDKDIDLLQIVATQGADQCSTFRMLNWLELVVRNQKTGREEKVELIAGIILRGDGSAKVIGYRH